MESKKKKMPKYALWSIEMLTSKWYKLSDRRENLVNKVSRYDVQMQEIKDVLKARKKSH